MQVIETILPDKLAIELANYSQAKSIDPNLVVQTALELYFNQQYNKFNSQYNPCDLIKLTLGERQKILKQQAEDMLEYYLQDDEWKELQTWDEIDE